MELSATSSVFSNTSRNSDSTTSLGNPFQSSITPSVKKFFLISKLNLPWPNLRLSIAMEEQWVFCPVGFQALERDKPNLLLWVRGVWEGSELEQKVTCYLFVSFIRNPWTEKKVWDELRIWRAGEKCLSLGWVIWETGCLAKTAGKSCLRHRNLTGSCDFHYQYSVMC